MEYGTFFDNHNRTAVIKPEKTVLCKGGREDISIM